MTTRCGSGSFQVQISPTPIDEMIYGLNQKWWNDEMMTNLVIDLALQKLYIYIYSMFFWKLEWLQSQNWKNVISGDSKKTYFKQCNLSKWWNNTSGLRYYTPSEWTKGFSARLEVPMFTPKQWETRNSLRNWPRVKRHLDERFKSLMFCHSV